MNNCCCNAGTLLWIAEKCCDTSCVGTCPDSEEECNCADGLTFCDSYRQAQGMPAELDPFRCYWWFHNGCRYRIVGGYDLPCAPQPNTPHNTGRYGGSTERQFGDTDCTETCAAICTGNPVYYVPPAVWEPDCSCGDTKSVAFDAGGNPCCGCGCTNGCSKTCPSASVGLTLNAWPNGWVLNSIGCTEVDSDCRSCKQTGGINVGTATVNLNNYVGGNYCDQNCQDVEPCDPGNSPPCNDGGVGIGCSVSATVSISLQGILPADLDFKFGFSVERSCPEGDCNATPTWITGGPVAGPAAALGICDCPTPGLPCVACCEFWAPDGTPGSNAYELARTINQALGSGSGNCVTYTAVGEKAAWLGQSWACIRDEQGNFPSINACHECIFEPCVWIGPFFSNCNRKATWMYANALQYHVNASYSCGNFSIFNVDNNRCQCTGSQNGGLSGDWQSNPASIVEFSYSADNNCPGFPPFVAITAAPCMYTPTIG